MSTAPSSEAGDVSSSRPGRAGLLFVAVTAAALIGIGAYTAYQQAYAADEKAQSAAAAPKPPPTVVVEIPEVKAVSEWDDYTGRFEAIDEVDIRSRVTGYLQQVHFKDGDIVEKGDLLFTIDPRPFEAALKTAEARVAEAKATLFLANTNLARSNTLLKSSAISQQRVDQDSARVQQAQALLASARSELEQARLDLEFTTIESPITGHIGARNVDIGNLIRGDDENASPLTNIVSLNPIYVVFDIDQNAYLNYAKDGMRCDEQSTARPVRIALQGDVGYPHEGKMDFIANRIDEQTGTLRGRAVIDNPTRRFVPGLFARIQLLERDQADTVLIPDRAIALEQTNRVVYIVNDEDKVESRTVVLGPLIDGKRVIRSGLNGDERVVTRGLHRISTGKTVQVRLEGDEAAITLSQARQ